MEVSPEALDEAGRALLAEGLSSKEIATRLARETGHPRSDVYARPLALRAES